jgi:hypothetical protein
MLGRYAVESLTRLRGGEKTKRSVEGGSGSRDSQHKAKLPGRNNDRELSRLSVDDGYGVFGVLLECGGDGERKATKGEGRGEIDLQRHSLKT